jgi:hypothetical protein
MWRRVDLVWTDGLQPPAYAGSSPADFSTLKMEAIHFSETSVHTRSTRRHIPENGILHSHRREKLIFVRWTMISHTCLETVGPIKVESTYFTIPCLVYVSCCIIGKYCEDMHIFETSVWTYEGLSLSSEIHFQFNLYMFSKCLLRPPGKLATFVFHSGLNLKLKH